jgi:hypothetical protein
LKKVPVAAGHFFGPAMEPKRATNLNDFGLGSISLILLHHPLFQLDLSLGSQS